jgi:hypothetical protein
LFKATCTEYARAPSIGSIRTSRPSGRSCARCSLARTSPRTLSLAPSPACPVKGLPLASSYPAALGSSRVAPRLTAPTRKMRLSDFCNRLTTRAPTVLPDSRSRSVRAPRPCGHATRRLRYPVELRLTATLQLRPCHNPRGSSWAEAQSPPPSDTARYWYESLDRELSRAMPPVRRLVSRARACCPTSDVLCRDRPARPCLSAGLAPVVMRETPIPPAGCRWAPPPPPPRQKQPFRRNQDAFPRQVPSPPCPASATCLRKYRKPNPNSPRARHRTHWVGRLRTSFSPLEPHEDEPRAAERLSRLLPEANIPEACCQRQAPSACLPSTSAIKTAHEHSLEPSEPRSRLPTRRIQLALDLEETLLAGLGPRPSRRSPIPGDITLPPSPRPCGLGKSFYATPAELLRARGLSDERPTLLPR